MGLSQAPFGVARNGVEPRLTWRLWLIVAVVAAVLFGALYYRDHLSAHARELAVSFWQAVTAGDEAAVAGFLTTESPQTAAELVRFFHGYTQAGDFRSLLVHDAVEALQPYGLKYEVISGLVAPDRNTHSFVMGLTQRGNGQLRVLFVGTGYSGTPEGRILPQLTP